VRRRGRLAGVLVAALAAGAPLVGCSPLLSVPPPKTPLVALDQCSTSRFPAGADIYWAVNAASLALLFWGGAAVEYSNNQTATVPSWDPKPLKVGTGWLVGGVLSTAATVALIQSARYGLKSARDCEQAQVELMLRSPYGSIRPTRPTRGCRSPSRRPGRGRRDNRAATRHFAGRRAREAPRRFFALSTSLVEKTVFC
jgi:hypothetical protein